MLNKVKNKFSPDLKNSEFELFLSKFYGSLITRGRKDYAIKLFDEILINIKKKFKKDPFINLQKAINNLVPILLSTQKRVGKVYHAVPKIALGNRRFVVMLSWIIKKQKGKSNVIGLNINDISRHLIDASLNKGVLINLKKQHLALCLSGKHLLYTNRRKPFLRWKRLKLRKKKIPKKFYYDFRKRKYSKKRYMYLRKKKLLFKYGELVK